MRKKASMLRFLRTSLNARDYWRFCRHTLFYVGKIRRPIKTQLWYIDRSHKRVTLNYKEIAMALENHVESLKKKHARIDQMLREEEGRPGADALVLHRLKSQKLSLKDEIERLLHGQRIAA